MRSALFAAIAMLCMNVACLGQAQIWGAAPNGGANGTGTIFYTDSSGANFTKVFDFPYNFPGGSTISRPTLASDGNLYGMMSSGGDNNTGGIYEYDPTAGVYSLLYSFPANSGGYTDILTEYNSSGVLYGVCTGGGAYNSGFIFTFNIGSHVFSTVYDIPATLHIQGNCVLNYSSLTGTYYGVSVYGGQGSSGIIFEYDPVANTAVTKIDFVNYGLMINPGGYLTLNPNNNLWIGTTSNGVQSSTTYVFEFDPTADTVYQRASVNQGKKISTVHGPLLLNSDGKFYGLDPGATFYSGSVCNYDPITHVVTTKYSMSAPSLGYGGTHLVDGGNGKYYGTSCFGGISYWGNLYEYDPSANTLTNKATMNGTTTGDHPVDVGALLPNGTFIGAMPNGGLGGEGTLYSYNISAGTYSVLVTFRYSAVGMFPSSALTQASNGKLYGTTTQGGANNLGTLFEIDPVSKTFTKKFDFNSGNGDTPGGRMVLGNDNKLYGVTSHGSYVYNYGVIFQYDPIGNVYTKKYTLATNSNPNQFLSITQGNLVYGNAGGGPNSTGNLFEYNITTNTYANKKSQVPSSGTTVGLDNNIYGVGYTGSNGNFYKYNVTTGAYTLPQVFYGSVGNTYTQQMVSLPNGDFMSSYDYQGAQSALYKINLYSNTAQNAVHILPAGLSQYNINGASLVVSNNQKVYGLCVYNDTNSLFEYNLNTQVFTIMHSFSALDGIPANLPLTLINASNPVITSQPVAGQQLCVGQTFTTGVVATGSNLKYQWYKNGTSLMGDTLSTISISSVALSDSGYYHCLVTGNNGFATSNSTYLSVNAYPNLSVNAATNPVCAGVSVQLTASGAATYTWSTNAGSATTNTVSVNAASTTIYTVTGANGNCMALTGSTITLTVIPAPSLTVSSTADPVCAGESFTLTASGATSYTWNPGGVLSDTTSGSISSTTTYSVTGSNSQGCLSTDTIVVAIDQCVWPGDADENLVVDNNDLLPIGIKYGMSGIARAGVSNAWQGFHVANWSDSLINNTNDKYIDCNGDGLIDMNDTLAITINYSSTHAARPLSPSQILSQNADMYFLFEQPQYFTGDTVRADLYIGSTSSPQTSFYGAAFTINYDASNVVAGSESFNFVNSWVGNIDQTNIKFSKLYPGSGWVDASLVRITGTNTSGWGKVGTLQFILASTAANTQLYFTANNAYKTDSVGNIAYMSTELDTFSVLSGPNDIRSYSTTRVSAFPNPATTKLQISGVHQRTTLRLINLFGETVLETETDHNTVIDLPEIPAGTYTLDATDHAGRQFVEIMISK